MGRQQEQIGGKFLFRNEESYPSPNEPDLAEVAFDFSRGELEVFGVCDRHPNCGSAKKI